jgi:hypothetical protein
VSEWWQRDAGIDWGFPDPPVMFYARLHTAPNWSFRAPLAVTYFDKDDWVPRKRGKATLRRMRVKRSLSKRRAHRGKRGGA